MTYIYVIHIDQYVPDRARVAQWVR